ncbi:hypothetical protein WMY93_014749 [Mugilogobius chulae]|uniref:Uncharacterized protein n=1 Tax=Mugilogobius chulae TaxID=88201 RepID=A0AAW0NZP2_9GOBI
MAKGKRKKKNVSGNTVTVSNNTTIQHCGTPEPVSPLTNRACNTSLDDTNEWPALEKLKTVLQVFRAKYLPAPEPVQVDLDEPKQAQVLCEDHLPAPEQLEVDLTEPTQVQELVAIQPPETEIVQIDLREPKQVQVCSEDRLPEPELVQMDQSKPTEVDRPVVSEKQMRKTKRISKNWVVSFPGDEPEFNISFGEVDRSLFKLSSQKTEKDQADTIIATQTLEPEQEENQMPENLETVEAFTAIETQTPEPEQEKNQMPENLETVDKELLSKSVTSEQKDTNPLTPESSEILPSATQIPDPEEEPQIEKNTTLERTDDEVPPKTLQVTSEPTEHTESNPLTVNDSNFPQLTRETSESRRNVSWQPKKRGNWKARNSDNQTPTEDERKAQSSPRESKVPQESSHQNLIEVSGPSMPPNLENIAPKNDGCLSLEIPIQQQEINICTGQEESNKAENKNNEILREPSVRPKCWRGNRYRYNNEFRQNNFSREYRRDSQVPEFHQSRYQRPSSFQTVAPREEQEEEPIITNRRNRYQTIIIPDCSNNGGRGRGAHNSKKKNCNRRSKQTLRLQRLLIQPQWNNESESEEDDSDEDILMSQLNPIST